MALLSAVKKAYDKHLKHLDTTGCFARSLENHPDAWNLWVFRTSDHRSYYQNQHAGVDWDPIGKYCNGPLEDNDELLAVARQLGMPGDDSVVGCTICIAARHPTAFHKFVMDAQAGLPTHVISCIRGLKEDQKEVLGEYIRSILNSLNTEGEHTLNPTEKKDILALSEKAKAFLTPACQAELKSLFHQNEDDKQALLQELIYQIYNS
ncbi:MAG: hypothetical protein S4CHLAM102_14470 [Chlamydiia bacterium]|nr:hypothetical protein [Chlamydiia bacterium]